MSRPARRDEVLEAAIAHVAENGIGDLSLRELAEAIGTSHRMLIHYFGSKQQLFVEIIRAVERRQRETMLALQRDPDLSPADGFRALWRKLTEPELAMHERLFFEVYGQALQGRPEATPILEDIVESWLEPATALEVARGVSPERARATARLGLAVVRGLLLDFLATGNRAGADAAIERFIDLYEADAVLARD